MKVELMRSEIIKVYPGDAWKKRVMKMHDSQVIAIYNSFLKNDRFNKSVITMPKGLGRSESFKQMSMFEDYLLGYDESSGVDHTAVVVGKRRDGGVIEVSNVYYDEEAMLYLNRDKGEMK